MDPRLAVRSTLHKSNCSTRKHMKWMFRIFLNWYAIIGTADDWPRTKSHNLNMYRHLNGPIALELVP
jgi:hypothetical protein